MSKRSRALPLAPEDRRRAIVEAVIPLLLSRGAAVTTREMAEAACIAEGTIFRVFPDKAALVFEAVRVGFDPEPTQRALADIYPEAPLDIQLAEAARILLERSELVFGLLSVLRTLPHPAPKGPVDIPPFVALANTALNQSLAKILERNRERLRFEPLRAASAFRGLLLASVHPSVALPERLTIDEIVGVFLDGVLQPEAAVVG
ncbi:MAG TPA: TetR/AcrR family transcriptional regulator [Acidimicrobiia bacterium]|nr:TetR/AcrR family transcriptional regulator [Acidimicrobiia bacterium]